MLGLTAELVRRGLPRAVGVGIRWVAEPEPPLFPIEEQALGVHAVERRRRFFSFGRAAARDALHEIGVDAVGVGRGPGGQPLWPLGIAGAISHSADVAVAVVGRTSDYLGLGVDVEELGRGLSVRAARLVCRPSEMEWVDVGSSSDRLIMLFSAKEAVFKAVYPIEQVWLGFGDAELTWHADRCEFEARLLKAAGARLSIGSVLPVRCTVTGTFVLSTTYCLA